jgi:predicted aspartyl protease
VPTITCNPPLVAGVTRFDRLVEHGAVVPLTVRSRPGAAEAKLEALIDTGSEYSAIDERIAQQLQLVLSRQEPVNVLNQTIVVIVYRAELEIPQLGFKKFVELLGALLSGKHQALFGRAELRDCKLLAYEGASRNVALTR